MTMPLNWLPSVDKYISDWYLWTDEELDVMDNEKRVWLATQRRPSFQELLEVYPQARPMMRLFLKKTIATCEADLTEAKRLRADYEKRAEDWTRDPKIEWLPSMVNEILMVSPLTEGREKTIKEAHYYLGTITRGGGTEERAAIQVTKEQIARARETDIRLIVQVDAKNRARCVFHEDTHPSMQVFKDNHVHCFSCAGHGDVIDVYRAIHKCGLIEAVKSLMGDFPR